MKWKICTLVLLLSAFVFVPVSFADAPAYHYGLVQCSGLSLTELTQANQRFDTAYGWNHQLTTSAQWSASYESRVNEFASTLGCPQVFSDDQLTLHYRLYDDVYRTYLDPGILPIQVQQILK